MKHVILLFLIILCLGDITIMAQNPNTIILTQTPNVLEYNRYQWCHL